MFKNQSQNTSNNYYSIGSSIGNYEPIRYSPIVPSNHLSIDFQLKNSEMDSNQVDMAIDLIQSNENRFFEENTNNCKIII